MADQRQHDLPRARVVPHALAARHGLRPAGVDPARGQALTRDLLKRVRRADDPSLGGLSPSPRA